jgi:hypothetical protein
MFKPEGCKQNLLRDEVKKSIHRKTRSSGRYGNKSKEEVEKLRDTIDALLVESEGYEEDVG